MKYSLRIDAEREEEVIVYAHERSKLTDDIENLINEADCELIGYGERDVVRLDASEITCFIVEDNKVYAICNTGERMWIKLRLYALEKILGDGFVKLNQSCIANVKKIKRFDASISGALTVVFKNGYKDYVSRRQLKTVKERIGFNL